jgi:hypothetical protein
MREALLLAAAITGIAIAVPVVIGSLIWVINIAMQGASEWAQLLVTGLSLYGFMFLVLFGIYSRLGR